MRGLDGNDTYYVDSADDLVIEGANQGTDIVAANVSYALSDAAQVELLRTTNNGGTADIDLTGSLGQTINGNAGSNVINGRGGNDVLTGLGGSDTFVFDTALGSTNVDRIADFSAVADDTIELHRSIFSAIATTGSLAAIAFKDIAAGTVDSNDRIIYNSDTGVLAYDRDGSGTAYGSVTFAVLTGSPTLAAADFFVV